MISVIVHSVNNELLAGISRNIEQTIGVAHEIIAVDDASGALGICKAYNMAAAKATFNIFCFVDENVLFDTQGWGHNVISHLTDSTIGLIGISGGSPKSKMPEGWNDKHFLWSANYIHSYFQDGVEHSFAIHLAPSSASIKQVVCLSGALLCTKREVYGRYQFDEAMTTHLIYNIDYSLQVYQDYKVCVVFDILILHHAEVILDRNWIKNAIKLSNKWKQILPLSVDNMSFWEFREHHWNCMSNFVDKLIELKLPLLSIIKIYCRFSLNRFFRYQYFLHLFKYIVAEHRKVVAA